MTNALPRFAFGVDLSNDLALADRFYIRAETLLLHAEAHADDLNLDARLAFLSVGIEDGHIDLEADVEIDLTVLDPNNDHKITLHEIADNIGSLVLQTSGTLDGALPIVLGAGILNGSAEGDFDIGTVTFEATDVFDLDTYDFNFDGLDADALNFGNIDAASIVSLIGRLADELDNLRGSGFFDSIDVPLVNGAVDAVLDFADVISSGLLYDKGSDGVKDGEDRLVTDLNAALEAAGLGSIIIAQGTGPIVGHSLTEFKLTSGDAKFTLSINGTDYVVTLAQSATSTNTLISDLVADLNTSILAALPAGLDGKVVAAIAGTSVALRIVDASATPIEAGFSAASDDPAVVKLGLPHEATITVPRVKFEVIDPTVTGIKVAAGPGDAGGFAQLGFLSSAATSAALAHVARPTDYRGILASDAKLSFTIQRTGEADKSVEVTFTADSTSANIGIGNDTIKLLRADNSATFDTMQSLTFRLGTILGLGDAVAYDPDAEALTINLGALLPGLEFDKDFPIDFDLPLGPLGDIQSNTLVNVHAEVGFAEGFTLGVYLGDQVPGALADLALDTELDVLNDGDGVDIKTDPAFTAPLPVVSTVRQLSGDATFTITLDGDPTAHEVVVPQDQTNANLAELVDDINTAIAHVTALAGKIQAVADGNRISLKAVPTVTGFSLTAAQGDPAIKDLGFSKAQTASGPLVGDSLDTFKLVSGDAHFTLTVAGVAYAVTVPLASTVLPTANTTIDQLVADVNAALLVAFPDGPGSLDHKIVAAKSGTALVLRIADASITKVGFAAAIDDPAVLELGLTNEATITSPVIEAVKDLTLVVGRLSQDVTITFATTGGPNGSVTLYADDTTTNTTILSLVSDLNKALSVPTLKTGVLTSFAPTSD